MEGIERHQIGHAGSCDGVLTFSAPFLDSLIAKAQRSSRRRHHCNVHQSYQDHCQRLFNAITVGSYIRPHRHALDPKAESLIAVRGHLALVVFNDDGEVTACVGFGADEHSQGSGYNVGVELQANVWHTVLALRENSVLFEAKAGPFDPGAAKELAPWAPAEDSEEALEYLKRLRAVAESLISRT